MKLNPILETDLNDILTSSINIDLFQNKTVFITGGTGFIGKWLLYSLIYGNEKNNLNINIVLLTRSINRFLKDQPYFVDKKITYIEADVRTFNFPKEDIDFIIHAATEANAKLNIENPFEMVDVIVDGTKRVLLLAKEKRVKKFLFLSSGAVYGKQPEELDGFYEDFSGAPDPLLSSSAYGESKRLAEFLCSSFAFQYSINVTIARCFAFVGPFLSLDSHFAIGNFINDGLHGRDITISGNGMPSRSYMYASDLVIWLWAILLHGKSGEAYNVGSDKAVSIKELATTVSGFFQDMKVEILGQTKPTDRNQNYIPNIEKAWNQLFLKNKIALEEAIYKTICYHKYNEKRNI